MTDEQKEKWKVFFGIKGSFWELSVLKEHAAKYGKTSVVCGLVVPFILFWGGMLLPLVTDNVFFVIFALLPFHGWCCIFIINSIETDRLTLNSFTFSLLTSFFIPLFRSIMGLELGTISLMMLVNAGFSFPLAMIYTVMSEVNHHKGPIFLVWWWRRRLWELNSFQTQYAIK
ncbi:hypothetical protein [uncultured Fibrobacter sp.]|uniref:hypothetical protein n=1 Tax=uncultured Fibrobacter sp. TaxID=261512 RepID=UPI0028063039|nr:hypothetical protein [uncultured Fibrobacter sp.]